jgi:hypothetical protein
MKKKDWILIVTTALYSFLFYGENPGINLSIFTLIIIIGMIIKEKEILKNKNWMIIAICCLVTAFSVGYYGNSLSLIANYLSLLILIGMSMSNKSSIFFSLVYGIYSFLTSPIYLLINATNKKEKSVDISKYKSKTALIGIPIVITIIFFMMYKNSNPIFAAYADKINFDWISWGWVFFTLLGFLFLYGVFKPSKIEEIAIYDEVESLNVNPEKNKELIIFGKTILVVDEYFSGKVLFILLNILIALVNLLDFNFIFNGRSLPGNLTFAEFLHQGVGMLVTSIAISILIILFYFRGQINFYKENKTLRLLAYLWMLQNVFMLFSVCMKNNMYIETYGLTYKRIGIYVYALLTIIGLITTALKVYKVKINMYLIRMNGWTFYAVLIISCMVNWDSIIINYNQNEKRECDYFYMVSFSNAAIPQLIELEDKIKEPIDQFFFHKALSKKIKRYSKMKSKESWKSWNYQDNSIKLAINKLNKIQHEK